MTEYAFDFGSHSKWLKISVLNKTCYISEVAHFFSQEILIWLKKLATSEIQHVIEVLSHFACKPIQNQMNIRSCDNHLIR